MPPLLRKKPVLISRERAKEMLKGLGPYASKRKGRIVAGFFGILLLAHTGTSWYRHYKAVNELIKLDRRIYETLEKRPWTIEHYLDYCEKRMREEGIVIKDTFWKEFPHQAEDIFLKGGKRARTIIKIQEGAFKATKKKYGILESPEDLPNRDLGMQKA